MQARPVPHPSADVLAAFSHGKLNETAAAAVRTHLESCQGCYQAAATRFGESFLQRVRAAASIPTRAPLASAQVSIVSNVDPSIPPELRDHPHYKVVRELGRGGMGVVYLATNKLLQRPEVLKVMNKALLDREGAIDRFLREIRSAAKLSHPNVVIAYNARQLGDLLVFAMEYVPGENLADAVKNYGGPLPVLNACYYVQQVALGLQHAYEKRMVHRDIKPHNLILAKHDKKHIVKILDFGLAKARSEGESQHHLTGSGQMLGTPDYMAPEQWRDAANADIRADIYSLGCTLYFLLAGHAPFKGRSLPEIWQAHESKIAKPLHEMRPDVSPQLAAVAARMMAKRPGQRYQTPIEVAQALLPFLKPVGKGTSAGSGPSRASPVASPVAEENAQAQGLLEVIDEAVRRDTLTEGNSTIGEARKRPPSQVHLSSATKRKRLFVAGAIALVVLFALIGIWASSVLKVKTKDGTIVLENLPAEADVLVDGEKVTVIWDDGGKKAQITVKSGTRNIVATKDGVKVIGEKVEIEDGGRKVLTARLEALPKDPPPARGIVNEKHEEPGNQLPGAQAKTGKGGNPPPPPDDQQHVVKPDPKTKPEDTKQDDRVRTAIANAIDYLRQTQAGAQWLPGQYEEGTTCLALLALLQSGVEPDDAAVAKALTFVRKLHTEMVYTLSLQTAVLCQLNAKEDAAAIQGNIDRLLASILRDPQRRFIGWTYRTGKAATGVVPDNSNTAFAVLALDAASAAGAKIDGKVWLELQEFYLRTQREDGGWGYMANADQKSMQPSHKSTLSMTCHGVCGLLIVRKHFKGNAQNLEKTVPRGLKYITDAGKPNSYYALYSFGRVGLLWGKPVFRNDREDATRLLLKEQSPNGAWKAKERDNQEVIATSFALLFLAQANEGAEAKRKDGQEEVKAPAEREDAATVVVTKASGLKYIDLKVGTGKEAKAGDNVTVHYAGTLKDGKKFDESSLDGPAFSFQLGKGKVWKGWDEGIVGMREGGKRKLIMPPELGRGAGGGGRIPPNAELHYEIELLGITVVATDLGSPPQFAGEWVNTKGKDKGGLDRLAISKKGDAWSIEAWSTIGDGKGGRIEYPWKKVSLSFRGNMAVATWEFDFGVKELTLQAENEELVVVISTIFKKDKSGQPNRVVEKFKKK